MKKFFPTQPILLLLTLPFTIGITPEIPFNHHSSTVFAQEIELEKNNLLGDNWQIFHRLQGHKSAIKSLAFTADSTVLFSGGSTSEPWIRLWQVSRGIELNSARDHRTAINSLEISPDGKILATSAADGGMSIWSLENGQLQRMFVSHDSNVLSLAITPDSKKLVSGGLDGIKVWDLTTLRPYYTLARFGYSTYDLAIHPNGNLLASSHGDGRISFWNILTGQKISEMRAHSEIVRAVTFTPDGRFMITGSDDRTVKVWDAVTNRLVYVLRGHPDQIRAIAVHPNGKIIASGSYDGVRLWNLDTGRLITRLDGHTDWVNSLAFSPDGNVLATGGFDEVINLWQIAPVENSDEKLAERSLTFSFE